MTLNRTVLGRKPNFDTTKRATAGQTQVRSGLQEFGGLAPQNLSASAGAPGGWHSSASAAPPGAAGMPAADTRLGYQTQWERMGGGAAVAEAYSDPASQGIMNWLKRDLDWMKNDLPVTAFDALDSLGLAPESWRDAADDQRRVNSYRDSGSLDRGPDHLTGDPLTPSAAAAGSDQNFDRGGYGAVRRAALEEAGKVEGVDRDQIMGAIQTAYTGFEADAAMWRSMRAQALADGEAETAAAYDAKIRGIEQEMDDLKREIQVVGDVESWYRSRIEAPFLRARDAAANVNFQPTLDLKSSAVGRIDEEYLASNQRLDAVLADIGFTPEQTQAMKLAAAEDNAVAAAQMEVLDATATRPGFLEEQKKLMFHTADQLRYSELRQSAGNELVETEPRKRALDKAAEDLNFLTKEKQDAIARTRRAVERSYGEGPKIPDRETITATAMETMLDSLAGDIPPGQKQAYLENVWGLVNAGFGEISDQNIISWYEQGLIPAGPEITNAVADIQARIDAGTVTQAQAQGMLNDAYLNSFDDEDRMIFQSLFDTYESAWAESEQIIAERSARRGSGAGGSGNSDKANITAAKEGQGAYGQRRIITADYASTFREMGIRVQGDNYYRPWEDPAAAREKGRDPNSDHLTAGALDLFLHVNNPDDMAMWRNRVKPMLDELIDMGVVANYLPPGANDFHRDHAHVSFALGQTNDGEYGTTDHFAGDGHDHDNASIPEPSRWTF